VDRVVVDSGRRDPSALMMSLGKVRCGRLGFEMMRRGMIILWVVE